MADARYRNLVSTASSKQMDRDGVMTALSYVRCERPDVFSGYGAVPAADRRRQLSDNEVARLSGYIRHGWAVHEL
jgi:hypothetical protein